MDSLPSEIVGDIFSWLNPKNILDLQLLSQHYNCIIRTYPWYFPKFKVKPHYTGNFGFLQNYNIKNLNLSCTNVTNNDIQNLKYCQKLKIVNCPNFTFESVKNLINLKILIVDYSVSSNNAMGLQKDLKIIHKHSPIRSTHMGTIGVFKKFSFQTLHLVPDLIINLNCVDNI